MKMNRKAVISLPIRLMVVFLILAISTPALMNVLEENERTSSMTVMDREFSRFTDSVAKTHYSGINTTRTFSITVPDDCEVIIGGHGSDEYSIRAVYKGDVVMTRYMEQPPVVLISDLVLDPGEYELTMRSVLHQGRGAVEVLLS